MGLFDRAVHEVAGGFDRFFHRTVLNGPVSRKGLEKELGPRERVAGLKALLEDLEHPRFIEAPDEFFHEPELPHARLSPVRQTKNVVVDDLELDSTHRAHRLHFDEVGSRWSSYADNHIFHARRFRQPGSSGRPAIILLHGYLAGHHAFEEKVWPLRWMLKRGLDVVLAVLPFHGPRARSAFAGPPPFPASDPRFTIEGFRQAMADLRALVRWLRSEGAPAVGAMGMSLGGYSSALLATLEPIDFVVPFIPLASVADFAKEGNRFIGTVSQREEQHRLLDEVYSVVSPLARPCRVPSAGRLVIAGKADAITPLSHAERIAEHFEAPLETFAGGHLLQLRREDAFRAVGRMLGQLGLLEPR